MSDIKECSWQCPTCLTEFAKNGIGAVIYRIEESLKHRSSASLDCNSEKVLEMQKLLRELKSLHIKYIRKPSNMMQSQNAVSENAKSEL